MLTDEQKKDLAQKLYDAICATEEYEPRAYSGRGMYGKQCLAVNVAGPGDAFALGVLVGKIAAVLGDFPRQALSPSTDSMGQGLVLYWRALPWVGVTSSDEEE